MKIRQNRTEGTKRIGRMRRIYWNSKIQICTLWLFNKFFCVCFSRLPCKSSPFGYRWYEWDKNIDFNKKPTYVSKLAGSNQMPTDHFLLLVHSLCVLFIYPFVCCHWWPFVNLVNFSRQCRLSTVFHFSFIADVFV